MLNTTSKPPKMGNIPIPLMMLRELEELSIELKQAMEVQHG